jgi:hypothetical protein
MNPFRQLLRAGRFTTLALLDLGQVVHSAQSTRPVLRGPTGKPAVQMRAGDTLTG